MANSYAVGYLTKQALADRSTTQEEILGAWVRDQKGNVFRYAKGVASGAKGKLVHISKDWATTLVTTTTNVALSGQKCAIMCAAAVATEFGWVCTEFTEDTDAEWGIIPDGSMAVNGAVQTTATGGYVDDAATETIAGIWNSTTGGTQGTVKTTFSWCDPWSL